MQNDEVRRWEIENLKDQVAELRKARWEQESELRKVRSDGELERQRLRFRIDDVQGKGVLVLMVAAAVLFYLGVLLFGEVFDRLPPEEEGARAVPEVTTAAQATSGSVAK